MQKPPTTRPPPQRPAPRQASPAVRGASSAIGTWLLGFVVTGGAGAAIALGGDPSKLLASLGLEGPAREEARPTEPAAQETPPQAPPSTPDAGAPRGDATAPSPADAGVEHVAGPFFAIIVPQASIYSGPEALRERRIGYVRQGERVELVSTTTYARTSGCEAGWYRLAGGGYLCGKYGTLNLDHPKVRFGPTPPNLEDILPYRYAWNTALGTPLYRVVPSRDQMLESEPYLRAAPAKAPRDDRSAPAPSDPRDRDPAPSQDTLANVAPSLAAALPAERKAWELAADGIKPELKLADLVEDPGGVVVRRLAKGFFIAVDKSFAWNGRSWYQTPEAFVAPSERFAIAKPATFAGVEIAADDPNPTVGFILTARAQRYRIDPSAPRQRPVSDGTVDHWASFRLTGDTVEIAGAVYRKTTDGWWMKAVDGTYTQPGPPPDGLAPGEKWIDVNLTRQTLVAFEGDKPVFATLVSTGKHARDPQDKVHDHRTVQGTFRVREKHVSATMDGDGPAPGDQPYSIEDVPYVMYFEGSYALHGAFWHQNFGHEKSHGCVNLAPADAKRLFSWADPPVPPGWHGALASRERPGSRVVVHE